MRRIEAITGTPVATSTFEKPLRANNHFEARGFSAIKQPEVHMFPSTVNRVPASTPSDVNDEIRRLSKRDVRDWAFRCCTSGVRGRDSILSISVTGALKMPRTCVLAGKRE